MNSQDIQRIMSTTVEVSDPDGQEDTWTGSLHELLKDNADGLPEDEFERLSNIKRGETLELGGGAAPRWTVRVV